jgi:alkylhydroperoxidase/carboxymuconolactone decarboxylase family protein YurZ
MRGTFLSRPNRFVAVVRLADGTEVNVHVASSGRMAELLLPGAPVEVQLHGAAPDRKTHELIRLVCTVILRNRAGILRHSQFAAEVGATWDEVLGAIMLTVPAFGMLAAVEAIPVAREGFDAAEVPEAD